jgi:hypothetical protein
MRIRITSWEMGKWSSAACYYKEHLSHYILPNAVKVTDVISMKQEKTM